MRHEGRKRPLTGFFIPLILPVLLLLLWEWSVSQGVLPRTLIASPVEVAADFVRLLGNGELLIHALVSLQRLIAGFLIGTAVGLAAGVFVGVSRLAERLVAPTLQLLAPIPAIAWIPLFIILFGISDASKIVLIAFATFFVVYFNTVQGIRSADQKLVELAQAYQKTNWELIWRILFPSALPQVFTGLRVALGLSWILLIAAEVIASSKGLGWLIWDSRNFSRPDDMIVGMIAIGILGKASDMALVALERRLTVWRTVFQGK